MDKPIIPFSLLPPQAQVVASKAFKGMGNFLTGFTPLLAEDLEEAQMSIPPREYLAAAIASAAANAVVIALVFALAGSSAKVSMEGPIFLMSLLVGATTMVTAVYYPKIIARRRSRQVEKHLIPATRQLLIELRSGVPLFNAMASISDDYGETSKEFKKIVQHIDAGVPEIDALAEATRATPSLQFKKLLWQLSNALKVGSDLADALEAIIDELVKDRVDQIRRYGQELSPWTLVYMMAAVVIPSLGITLLIVISSFMGVVVPNVVLAVAIAYLVVFQVFFMNFIGTRRPSV